MRRRHFEELRPVCPVCRGADDEARLTIAETVTEANDSIVEGRLVCTRPTCQHEYPIIDGIPIIVRDIRAFVSNNVLAILGRNDLALSTTSLIGDACGPASEYDTSRQHLSSYVSGHYADCDIDRERITGDSTKLPLLALLDRGLDACQSAGDAPTLDVGCSVGRTTFELAGRSSGLVLGVDLNFAMLRVASSILRSGRCVYDHRHVGMVYERREIAIDVAGANRVDFWACDASDLPVPRDTFGLGVALNVLDCVQSPMLFLQSLARGIRPGSSVVLASPYDWSLAATPIEQWLGGHSQRGPRVGASAAILRDLLTPDDAGQTQSGLVLDADLGDAEWTVQLHDRSSVRYLVDLIVAAVVGRVD